MRLKRISIGSFQDHCLPRPIHRFSTDIHRSQFKTIRVASTAKIATSHVASGAYRWAMANLDSMEGLSELVKDSRLYTIPPGSGDQQSITHTPSPSSRRNQQEVWVHVKSLGYGGQGSVDLQKREQDGTSEFRAVKTIRIPHNRPVSNRSLFIRELEAISKFSQARVSPQSSSA